MSDPLPVQPPEQPDWQVIEPAATYPGIRRVPYFLGTLVLGALNFAVALGGSAELSLVFSIVLLILSLMLVASRLRNIGSNGWWCLLMLIPIVNIFVGLRCLAMPEGYRDHRTLDTAGKVVIGLFIGIFVLGILAAVALPLLAR